MELRIVHETCYDYATPVMLAQHMAHLRAELQLLGEPVHYEMTLEPSRLALLLTDPDSAWTGVQHALDSMGIKAPEAVAAGPAASSRSTSVFSTPPPATPDFSMHRRCRRLPTSTPTR